MFIGDDECAVSQLRDAGQRWLRRGELPHQSAATTSVSIKAYEWDRAMDCFDAANRIAARRNQRTV